MQNKKIEKLLKNVQKPARYIGGEIGSVIKNMADVDTRFVMCFPDSYEVGMSHLGIKILYGLLNNMAGVWCERCFAPWTDMQEEMLREKVPLWSLESFTPLREFDFVGFTLQYELSYTNVLNMLHLSDIPLRASDRDESYPLVIGGGPCACNPEPLADFFDLFALGESEEALPELILLYRKWKKSGKTKKDFLREASHIEGIYVPSLYTVSYHEDGTVESVSPLEGAPAKVRKRIIRDLDSVYYPRDYFVPFLDIVHDRIMLEVMRGCIRGCRFCQAGFIYRPLREKTPDTLNEQAHSLCKNTGYEEISLASLSTSDYSKIEPLLDDLTAWTDGEKINLSLPSLRVDNFSKELADKVSEVRKSSLTFAPEAGTQRLRDTINKNVTDEDIRKTFQLAFDSGYTSVKLYFMMGLPTETEEDIVGIAQTAQRVVDLYYSQPNKPKGKSVSVTVSVASFVPKPFTPFEFEPQDTPEMLSEKQKLLVSSVRSRKITVKWHDINVSFLEAALARGDRRLCAVVERAYELGCIFDGWSDQFHFDLWIKAFEECGIDPHFYANRTREYDEIMPWNHLDFCIDRAFFIDENKKAHCNMTTCNCKEGCSACGANVLGGGKYCG